jgi:multidrug resistance protein
LEVTLFISCPTIRLLPILIFKQIRKIHIVLAGILFIFNSAFGSSLPSGAHDAIADSFNIPHDDTKLVLLNSLYLVGFAIGPLIFGPLSEHVGRRPVLIGTFSGYIIFTMACALSPNFPALLVFRLLCGLNAASPNAVLGGLYADILDNPQTRGIAMALFMVVTGFGPQLAPLVSGFISTVSWRWTFWVGLAAAGVGYPFVLFIPETYVPVLKERHARRLAKAGKEDPKACYTVKPQGPGHRGDGVLSIFMRPFVMTAKEPVLLFASLFMGFTYAMFYLYFQAYPIIFQSKICSHMWRNIGSITLTIFIDLYGLSAGVAGLAFLPSMLIQSCLLWRLTVWSQSVWELWLLLPSFCYMAPIIPKL